MNPLNPNEPIITREDLRNAVTYEARQAMAGFVLELSAATRDIRQIKWTIYGDRDAGEKGMVGSMKDMEGNIELILKGNDKRQWIQYGILIGLGLNLLQTTGVIEAIFKALH